MTELPTTGWYIVKHENGQCDILSTSETDPQVLGDGQVWGPFESQSSAIARRVGLIRAGKCKPA